MRALATVLVLGTLLGASPSFGDDTITTTATYSVSYKNFSPFKRIMAWLFVDNADFLEWKEMNMAITYAQSSGSAQPAVVGISITAPGERECFMVRKTSASYEGHMFIDVPVDLTPQAAQAYLNIWNYFLDDRTQELRIDVEPISPQHHKHNHLRCLLEKHRDGDRIIISAVPLNPKKRAGKAETIVRDGHPRILEMTTLEVKGVKIILTRKPQ
ncbi:hypothetical protein KGO95_02555 [Patescibacteria group bacterium]|nr:hypothetical protein [Patescibacteria group bacterium]